MSADKPFERKDGGYIDVVAIMAAISRAIDRLAETGIPPQKADGVFGDSPAMLELLREWSGAYESALPRGPHAQHCDCRYHRTRALLDKYGMTP